MILPYRDKRPLIEEGVYVSSNATVVGDVTLKKGSSVWFHSVMRGSKDHIHIDGDGNVQDNCTLHTGPKHLLQIEERVTAGRSTVPYDCMIEDGVPIGMGAIVLDGTHTGGHSIIGAGALVKERQQTPKNSLVVSSPARIIRKCNKEQVKEILEDAAHYVQLGNGYKEIDV